LEILKKKKNLVEKRTKRGDSSDEMTEFENLIFEPRVVEIPPRRWS